MIPVIKKVVECYNTSCAIDMTLQDICDFCNEFKVGGWFVEFEICNGVLVQKDTLNDVQTDFDMTRIADWANTIFGLNIDLQNKYHKYFINPSTDTIKDLIVFCIRHAYKPCFKIFSDMS